DSWESVDPEVQVSGGTHHHQRQHDHASEHRPADADFSELLHEGIAEGYWPRAIRVRELVASARSGSLSVRTDCPLRRPAGSNTTGVPTTTPETISTQSRPRRPVATVFSSALPLSIVTTFSIPAKVTKALAGTLKLASPSFRTISARANSPARNRPGL